MNAYIHQGGNAISTSVEFLTQRRYGVEGAPYLITMLDMHTGASAEQGATRFAQTHAVVDDYGRLVLVRNWQ